jgi:quercetin dioxygenase-like cupin family protein
MKTMIALLTFVTAVAAFPITQVLAEEPNPVILLMPGDVKWGGAPPIMPAGAKFAVMAGDPGKPGLFVIRLKFPAGYKIPAHWHPSDEQITVISGAFSVGLGDKFDAAHTKALPPGGFVSVPGKTNHFAMAKKETIIELSAIGPFEMTYVNPADDPTKTAAK